MKEWQQNVVGATVIIIIGIAIFLGATTIKLPAVYNTFLGIPYEVNPVYVYLFYQVVLLILLGIFTLGVGVGVLINTYSIYRLEKKLTEIPPPPRPQ